MPTPVLDAVGVASTDMPATVAFYTALGFTFPPFGADDQHVEATAAPGQVRLMIDAAALATQLIGEAPRPGNGSAFALLFSSPAEVDAAAAAGAAAGGVITAQPWDAFWGQRYCTIQDPDGYKVDLFAAL
ncbi:MAG TPA: glyoxalase [Aliiroseovarius sp.]|nr:glyoxalase [Aliiroseovarius sp.]